MKKGGCVCEHFEPPHSRQSPIGTPSIPERSSKEHSLLLLKLLLNDPESKTQTIKKKKIKIKIKIKREVVEDKHLPGSEEEPQYEEDMLVLLHQENGCSQQLLQQDALPQFVAIINKKNMERKEI